jgi:SAM-dependent methyltransferase
MNSIDTNLIDLGADAMCHLCGATGLLEFPAFRAFRRITSDCRPWPAGARLCSCPSCGSVQKIVDEEWNREVAELYAGYAIYDQAAGAEQAVFDQATGAAASRSTRLLTALRNAVELPAAGRMLDVGCGNGAMLRAFGNAVRGWSLAGTELDGKYRGAVESIPGVQSLHTCPPWEAPGEFDVITMIHVLEHIPRPEAYLTQLLAKLRPGGMLVVELPHHVANPFELLIADHCTHFAAETAAALLHRAGFEVVQTADDWVPKELTLVARRPPWSAGACHGFSESVIGCDGLRASTTDRVETSLAKSGDKPPHSKVIDCVSARIAWLAQISATARKLSKQRPVGLFGTSIAGTWLLGELDGAAAFFVDEDPHRIGKRWHDLPVYHPREIPAGSCVMVPLPTTLAASIARRIARPDVEFSLPPTMGT